MELVVDANILFSALMKDSTTRALILSDKFSLIVPQFVMDEFTKHISQISAKTSLDEPELSRLLKGLIDTSKIKIANNEELVLFLKDADKICPDPDDVQYFALALKHKCPLWSNDKALRRQSRVKVLSTEDILKLV